MSQNFFCFQIGSANIFAILSFDSNSEYKNVSAK